MGYISSPECWRNQKDRDEKWLDIDLLLLLDDIVLKINSSPQNVKTITQVIPRRMSTIYV